MPRRRSCWVSVAQETVRSACCASAESVTGRGALAPSAAARTSRDTRGIAPSGASSGPSTIGLLTRPTPSSSTSTVSPGATGREFAGVPVRITSPGSSVMKRERSATSAPKPKIRFAVRVLLHDLAVDARAQDELVGIRPTSPARAGRAA